MASIRIRNRSSSGGIPGVDVPGLTRGELAVNLADGVLWVGGTTDTPIYLSGVQTFNGLTGAVTGVTVGSANVFTQLNRFEAGISASGATIGNLVVQSGLCASGGITFNSLSHFTAGLSGSGATLGTLVVNNGISASGGVTFHNNVWVGGLLTANGGISAAGGVTFANTVYIGSTLSVAGDLTVVDESGSYAAEFVRSVGTTSDLPSVGKYSGQIYWVRGPTSQSFTENKSGYYYWDDFIVNPAGITAKWVRLTNAKNYNPTDLNQDGEIDGFDLSIILAAWGSQGYSGGNFTLAATNGTQNAFEIKIFGVTTGKKTRPFRITSDVTDPQIYMAGEFVDVDAKLIVKNAPNEPAIEILEGGGYALFPNGLQVSGGATVGGNVTISGLLSVTGGISAGCGVTFGCLTHFTQGLSASGATLGTLVVNGGATFNGPVYMGTTLTMNSNIQFNNGLGITGGFIDAGWY